MEARPIIRNARRLRRTMSLPEVLLWRVLKGSPAGFRFRRQHPLGPYVLDFYCHAARLAVEVDGVGHRMADRPARDAARDRWLAGQGVDVLRLPAAEVLRDVDVAAHSIVECEGTGVIGVPGYGGIGRHIVGRGVEK